MNFKSWFLLEGKAMNVSEDMINFAKEVIEILEKREWKFGEIIHQRVVSSKYGSKEIKVKTMYKLASGPTGDAVAKTGLIRLFMVGKNNPDYRSAEFDIGSKGLPVIKKQGTVGIDSKIPDYNVDFKEYYYVVIHELVHIFDVKVSSRPNWMKKYDAPSSMEDYHTSPHEQDAWMAHRAREFIDYYLDYYKGDKNKVKNLITHLSIEGIADIEPEATWHKHPKIWRKYLNTLYNLISQ